MRGLTVFSVVTALLVIVLTQLTCPSVVVAGDSPPSIYDKAVADPARLPKDRERDAIDKPVEVLRLAGFQPGMKVADIFAGGGYYSEIISDVVGPGGSVLLLNNTAYQNYAREELKVRLAQTRMEGGQLANVKPMLVESCDLRLGKQDLDGALIVMSYHDLYHADEAGGWVPIDAPKFLQQIHDALKPGGVLLIVDHAATAGSGKSAAQDLHRIDEEFAKRDIESHGFKLVKTWDGLRNPADDYAIDVFNKAVRHKTDRFVHVYQRT